VTELERPSLLQIATVFAAISATSFGGGQKASVRRQVVTVHKWITEDQFMEGLEFAQVMPGPNIVNLAIFCAQRARGIPGAIVAFLAATIPPFFIVLIAGALYFRFIGNPFVRAALLGCAAGAVGLTLGNAIELTWDLRKDALHLAIVAATAVAVSYFKLPLLPTLVVFGGLGMWHYHVKKTHAQTA
jgi:chromate transporter